MKLKKGYTVTFKSLPSGSKPTLLGQATSTERKVAGDPRSPSSTRTEAEGMKSISGRHSKRTRINEGKVACGSDWRRVVKKAGADSLVLTQPEREKGNKEEKVIRIVNLCNIVAVEDRNRGNGVLMRTDEANIRGDQTGSWRLTCVSRNSVRPQLKTSPLHNRRSQGIGGGKSVDVKGRHQKGHYVRGRAGSRLLSALILNRRDLEEGVTENKVIKPKKKSDVIKPVWPG